MENNFLTKIVLILVSLTLHAYANENWIQIEPINQEQASKPITKIDVDLSQVKPINKMIKNVTVIKQLVDTLDKKEPASTNNKNWFAMDKEINK